MRLLLLGGIIIGLAACSDNDSDTQLRQIDGNNTSPPPPNVQQDPPPPQDRVSAFVAATSQMAATNSDTSEPANIDRFGGSTFQEEPPTSDTIEPTPVL